MKEFLKRIKVLDTLTTKLTIEKNDFVKKLQQQVDDGGIGIFDEAFDALFSSRNEYKGQVYYQGFKIKRRRKFFDFNQSVAIATGSYKQVGDNLIIETEINGFRNIMVPFYIFLAIFYSIFFITFLSTGILQDFESIIPIVFILLHAAFMMGIPYFVMRRSTSKLKYALEREFHFIANTSSTRN